MNSFRTPILLPIDYSNSIDYDNSLSKEFLKDGLSFQLETYDGFYYFINIRTLHFCYSFRCFQTGRSPGAINDDYILTEELNMCEYLDEDYRGFLTLENLIKERMVSVSAVPASQTMVSGFRAVVEKMEPLMLEMHRIVAKVALTESANYLGFGTFRYAFEIKLGAKCTFQSPPLRGFYVKGTRDRSHQIATDFQYLERLNQLVQARVAATKSITEEPAMESFKTEIGELGNKINDLYEEFALFSSTATSQTFTYTFRPALKFKPISGILPIARHIDRYFMYGATSSFFGPLLWTQVAPSINYAGPRILHGLLRIRSDSIGCLDMGEDERKLQWEVLQLADKAQGWLDEYRAIEDPEVQRE
ncbi:MAG: hypothetical protein Q9202_002301 [Teloschistes flavicans]